MIVAFAADAKEPDILALGDKRVGTLPGEPDDRGVERAAQAAFGGADKEKLHPVRAGAASSRGAPSRPLTDAAILPSTFSMRSAKGRAASAATGARRSFEAATICMALVIFCVALVAAMRFRRSFRLGISSQSLLFIVMPSRPSRPLLTPVDAGGMTAYANVLA